MLTLWINHKFKNALVIGLSNWQWTTLWWCSCLLIAVQTKIFFSKITLSAAELMSFSQLGAAIWYRWTIICVVPSKIPETIDALKDNICEAIGEIQLYTIDYVLKNWTERVGYCMASRASHLNEIIFSLLTRRIVLSNKERNLRKYSLVFLKHFPKKNGIWRTLYNIYHLIFVNIYEIAKV